jgi:hypothetical protein
MNEITLGDVTVIRVEEMHGPVGMTPEQFFPGSPASTGGRTATGWCRTTSTPRTDIVQVAMQTWALRSEGRTILVDTGIGNDKPRPAVGAWDHLSLGYLENLAKAGIGPRTWTWSSTRTCTSTTSAGTPGSSTAQWVPTFPNATYLMPKLDFEHFDPAKNPNIAGESTRTYSRTASCRSAAGQVRLWEGEYVVDGNLRLSRRPATPRGQRPSS